MKKMRTSRSKRFKKESIYLLILGLLSLVVECSLVSLNSQLPKLLLAIQFVHRLERKLPWVEKSIEIGDWSVGVLLNKEEEFIVINGMS